MITLKIKGRELFDEKTQSFIQTEDTILELEHSLVSISKWEAKYKRPFISKEQKTREEILNYIKFMTITQNVDDAIYNCLDYKAYNAIQNYLEDTQTATWFTERPGARRGGSTGEQITSELVYYWMVAYRIPFETQYWNFNRLMTLIRICSVKQEAPKKRGRRDILNQQSALNAARRKRLGTKG